MSLITFEPAIVRQYISHLLSSRWSKLPFFEGWPNNPITIKESYLTLDFLTWLQEKYPESPLSKLPIENINGVAISKELCRQLHGVKIVRQAAKVDASWGHVTTQIKMLLIPPRGNHANEL